MLIGFFFTVAPYTSFRPWAKNVSYLHMPIRSSLSFASILAPRNPDQIKRLWEMTHSKKILLKLEWEMTVLLPSSKYLPYAATNGNGRIELGGNKKSLWTEVHDDVSWHWIPGWFLFSCTFTQHHSESPTGQKCILSFLLKQSLMPRKRRGQKKKKKVWLHSCVHSVCCVILEVSSTGHHSQMGLPCVCVCVCVCVCACPLWAL